MVQLTRKAFFAALLAPFVALKAVARTRKSASAYAYRENGHTFYVIENHPTPEILSSWTDPVTGDVIVLAFFPGKDQPKDPNLVHLTEFRFLKRGKLESM